MTQDPLNVRAHVAQFIGKVHGVYDYNSLKKWRCGQCGCSYINRLVGCRCRCHYLFPW